MLCIEYNPKDGGTWPDGLIEDTVLAHYRKALNPHGVKSVVMVASELYINTVRLLIKRGILRSDKIGVVYVRGPHDRVDLWIKDDGRFAQRLPEGFCDTHTGILAELMLSDLESNSGTTVTC